MNRLVPAIWVAALGIATAIVTPAAAGDLTAEVGMLTVTGGIGSIASVSTPGGAVAVLTDTAGARFRIGRDAEGRLALAPDAPPAPPVRSAFDMLPDGAVVPGVTRFAAAWLSDPTDRYDHGILGDPIEAGGLRAQLANGEETGTFLHDGSVFEDLLPRLADLDGDGEDEILLVRSYQDRGAALAVYGLNGYSLEMVAQSEPIGRAHRWLNPVGVADFDGDGRPEAAVVRTPHIGGTLILYGFRDGQLVPKYTAHGFSNHEIGSRELGMSAVLDADGDGVFDLAVPGAARKSLRIVSFAGGGFRELANIGLDAAISTAIVAAPLGTGRPTSLVFGLKNGNLVAVDPGS